MSDITLESLIQEHKERIGLLKYQPDPPGCLGFSYYYYDDSEAYQKWLAKTKRLICITYPNDKDVAEFELISSSNKSPEQQKKLLAILEALALLPTLIPINLSTSADEKNSVGKESINITTNINNNNTQSQNQEQSLAVQLFIEAIQDDLTGRQIKELKSIVQENGDDLQKARSGIVDKLKDFGSDVASNIVANILINPLIWEKLL